MYRKNTWLRTMCCLQNEPVTYSPLLTKHRPRCSKIENYTNTHTTHLYFTDNFLCSLYLFSQSQQSLTKCNLFCFESPKLSLSFFNFSCSPMNVKMEQKGQSKVSKFYQLSNIASSPFVHLSFLFFFFFMFTNFTHHQILHYTKDTNQIHTKFQLHN